MNSPAHMRWGRGGFTLVEMVLVMSIMAVLATLVLLSLGNLKSTNLTAAGNMVTENMAYARELAVSKNQPTEVWFLRPQGGTSLDAMRVYLVTQSGDTTPSGPLRRLPVGVVLDSGTFLSPLIVTGNVKTWSGGPTKPAIPGYGTAYNAWFVRFMPDGITTLSSTSQWYVTLHAQNVGDQLSSVPANYAMISLDPVMGNVSLYRP